MKIPDPKKLKSGTWFIQLRINGESIYITADTAAECRKKAIAEKASRQLNKPLVRKSQITLSKAIDKYIDRRKNTLSPSTIRGYRSVQNNHFQKQMSQPVTKQHDWQAILDKEAETFSAKTIKNAWRFIASVLHEQKVDCPTVTLPQIVTATRPWLDPEDISSFVRAVRGAECEIAALLALHSLRRSEIMGLTWENINLKKETITVAGARVYNNDDELVYKKTNKNVTSARTVPIMIPELKAALDAVEKKEGFVVTCVPDVIRRRVNKICKANSLPEVGTHGLRHSFASLAYHLGLSERETMDLGGWADPQTMHKIYTHLAKADRLKAKNKMAQFYAGSSAAVFT